MAGSGKTTLMQRLNLHLYKAKKKRYIMNLDPAVHKIPYKANIDIRESVDYKKVMKQYNLGPNGAIMTCLNLFATQYDQVINLIEKRANETEYVLIDTPGQIEAFTWSASGQIITEITASTFPTVILYVVDTPRTESPSTFMSNMLYACSILYKTKLPFVVVFNKIDIKPHDFAENWMNDWESFQNSLQSDSTYMSTLNHSMSLVLDEFYQTIHRVGVSAATGDGIDKLFEEIQSVAKSYHTEYLPSLQKKIEKKKLSEEQKKLNDKNKFNIDFKIENKELDDPNDMDEKQDIGDKQDMDDENL
eukprot:TRINITY_DN14928_c0_g1_i1.p1 TRINITY_DN14928_c0_g1~~TRINITY_DN14928_c0_g1_i1.p1  ORF type:complete len:327 (+),score=81.48 TRINITY_DN14928_c0_g1_i1:72-983(+)